MHLQHGPIDLIIEAKGDRNEVNLAYQQAIETFQEVLNQLVRELPLLRKSVARNSPKLTGVVATRMADACKYFSRTHYITPMAAVAGAVADHLLSVMLTGRKLKRAYVNNGGDVALYLGSGETLDIGLCNHPQNPVLTASIKLQREMHIGGVATSGRHGRSFSLGIADSVTVLAINSATADAAATLIGNAIDLPESPKIKRTPAEQLLPDSDLGEKPVTTHVEGLTKKEKKAALQNGIICANEMLLTGRIIGVYASLQNESFSLGDLVRSKLNITVQAPNQILPQNPREIGLR